MNGFEYFFTRALIKGHELFPEILSSGAVKTTLHAFLRTLPPRVFCFQTKLFFFFGKPYSAYSLIPKPE